MDSAKRIVTTLPLQELWDDRGAIPAQKIRDLSRADIRELLRLGPVQFVVADLGEKPSSDIYLDEMPHQYAYSASEWNFDEGSVVILERFHLHWQSDKM